VHGWGISGSYFIPAAERLAAGFPVYVPDLPGHGRSDTPPEPLNISGLAQALLACMEAMKIERTFLVGHSMGCQIAVEVALQHPWRIDRLMLIGPIPDPTARSVAEQFRRFLIGSAYERLSLTQYLVKDYTRMGRRLVPEFRFMLEDPIEDKLPKVAVSSMVVRGEKDPIAPQRWIDEAARLLRTDRVAVITGWGHAVQYSAPTQLIDAIRPFLSQVLE
jgi:2-hydroxy-6-oxonona-2,4-dienedioate hydrolase